MDSTSEAFSWMQHHNGAGAAVQLSLLLLVCILTWLDPLVRSDRTTAGIAVCGWIFMCAIGTWRAAFVRNPSGVLAWAVAGLYALVIIATLGRPLLMLSDLLEEKERRRRNQVLGGALAKITHCPGGCADRHRRRSLRRLLSLD
jgi:hypothetical protein